MSLGRASLLTGVNDDDWDVITLQQASHFSGVEETYFPYVETLAAFVRERHPRAKLFINETWAYEVSDPEKRPAAQMRRGCF